MIHSTWRIFLKYIITFLIICFSFHLSYSQYTVNSTFGNFTDCDTMTSGIYIAWWDNDVDYSPQVGTLLDSMLSYRAACLDELGMQDPPNPEDGYYYNVYIHRPGDVNDVFFEYGWGNGQGTDINGYPFLTLPNGVLNDWVNNSHETFHIFQYNANSPGFAYSDDSQWYIEASANWFAGIRNLEAPRAFVEAESLVRVPQVPLWLSYGNYPSYYPSNWQRYVHQYALGLFLYYLTAEAGVPETMITQGFFAGTDELPQEYLYNQLGGDVFRNYFTDCAAHMTSHFDFILPYQAETNENEWNDYADPLDDNEFTRTYNNSGSDGWYRPADSLATTGWSFNTYRVLNSISGYYTFQYQGDPTGSYGSPAYFQGKVLVLNENTGASFYDLDPVNDLEGSLTLNVSPGDTAMYFIIACMPEVFQDFEETFQTFSYEMQIDLGMVGIPESIPASPAPEIARYNLSGQRVDQNYKGLQIIRYSDGTCKKEYNRAGQVYKQ